MPDQKKMPKVIELPWGYDVVEFPWGTAVRSCRKKQYISVHFSDGQELDLENWEVNLRDDGIELIRYNAPKDC